MSKRKPSDQQNKAGSQQPPFMMVPFPFMAQHPGGTPAGYMQAAGPNGGSFFMPHMAMSQAQATPPARSQASSKRSKAWEEDEEDEEDDDDDFVPPKKKRLSISKGSASSSSAKRREAPSAQSQIAMRKVAQLPDKFMGRPIVSPKSPEKDCVSCGVYLGEIMLLPCGHASFCTKCINKVHDKSNSLKRLQLCPVDSCLESISGWVRLHNVMA